MVVMPANHCSHQRAVFRACLPVIPVFCVDTPPAAATSSGEGSPIRVSNFLSLGMLTTSSRAMGIMMALIPAMARYAVRQPELEMMELTIFTQTRAPAPLPSIPMDMAVPLILGPNQLLTMMVTGRLVAPLQPMPWMPARTYSCHREVARDISR